MTRARRIYVLNHRWNSRHICALLLDDKEDPIRIHAALKSSHVREHFQTLAVILSVDVLGDVERKMDLQISDLRLVL
jgi:hypothetical protein